MEKVHTQTQYQQEGEELTPKSFRISREISDKIREISAQLGGNAQAAFARLIQTYEFQQAKEAIGEKSEQLIRFENMVSSLTRMYMDLAEECVDMRSVVREEYEDMLKSKDKTILELQKQVDSMKSTCEDATKSVEELESSCAMAKDAAQKASLEVSTSAAKIVELEKRNAALAEAVESGKRHCQDIEKDNITLQKKVNTLTQEKNDISDTLRTLKNQLSTANDKLVGYEDKISVLDKEYKDAYNKGCEVTKKEVTAEYVQAMAEKEKDYADRLSEITAQHNAAIADYQEKYMILLNKFTQ